MFRFALIVKISGASPETYRKVYENNESYNLFIGIDPMDETRDLIEELLEDDIEEINLCGAFDNEETKALQNLAKGRLEIFNAKYFSEELPKVQNIDSLREYGFISITKNINKLMPMNIDGEKGNTRIMLVKDLEMACLAAQQLVDGGIQLIELCSWFDNEKTQTIIDSINGKVPVSSCGLN